MYKKYLSLVIFAFLIELVPFPVYAQTPNDKLDARCFTQDECEKARLKEGVSPSELSSGFYNNTAETNTACQNRKDAAKNPLGFCLPAGQASTSVKFGGTSKFANIGVFIQYMYRYGVIFAGILAVIVIIIAGLQWAASGGNSSTIESAKNRITGAITGLILASTSYIILNTISPSTVNLRLPQVWLLREQNIDVQYQYCMGIPATASGVTGFILPQVAPWKDDFTSIDPASYKDAFIITANDRAQATGFPDKTETATTPCGAKMAIKDTQGASCLGTYCPNNGYCFDGVSPAKCIPNLFEKGGIGGTIKWTPGSGKYVDDIWLEVVCDGEEEWDVQQIGDITLGDGKNFYLFNNITQPAIDACGGREKVKGFFFIVEVNDSGTGVTLDDQWIGGRSFCTSATPKSCGIYGASTINKSDAKDLLIIDAMVNENELFTLSDIETNGQGCNFYNTEEALPNIGSGVVTLIASGAMKSLLGVSSIGNPGNANGTDVCKYLKDKSAQFDKAIRTRWEAKHPGQKFNP